MSSNTKQPKDKVLSLVIKRCLDVIMCSILLVLVSPLFLIMAIIVKFSSKGPIMFIQQRIGKDKKIFNIYKFRTMTVAPRNHQDFASEADDEIRTTKSGKFLRDFGLDELPQLLNIIKGDMSIIGPRPMLEETVNNMPQEYNDLLRMRPGVLSLAAIKGRRAIPMEKRIEYHAEYVRKWSLGLDFKIFFASLYVVFMFRNLR